MGFVKKVLIFTFGVILCSAFVSSAVVHSVEMKEEAKQDVAVEQGRTFVHHTMKRLAILLPAFMFKLGIMFTMLFVSMIASTKSLLVGTLLLALGVGHFIANRFNSAAPTHAHITVPQLHAAWPSAHAHHYVDRSDTLHSGSMSASQAPVGTIPAGYVQQQAYSSWKQ